MTICRYLEESTLRNLIKRYSEFINFPIFLQTTKEVSFLITGIV
jgi:heat shock protein beta